MGVRATVQAGSARSRQATVSGAFRVDRALPRSLLRGRLADQRTGRVDGALLRDADAVRDVRGRLTLAARSRS